MTAIMDAPHNGSAVKAEIDEDTDLEPVYILDGEHTAETISMIDACHSSGKLVPALWGDAGVGKTSLVQAMSRREGFAWAFTLLLGSQDRCDTLGAMRTAMVDDGFGGLIESTVYATPKWAIDANIHARRGKVFIFCDEIDKAPPDIQGVFLTILQDHVMPSGFRLHKNVHFIAAGNKVKAGYTGFELIRPLQNRLAHFEYKPPFREWAKGMIEAWGRTVSPSEDKLRGLVIMYLTSNGGHLHREPDEGSEENAWPSRRSWDNFATMAAVFMGDKNGVDRIRTAAIAILGKATGEDFTAKTTSVQLPTPQEIVKDPTKVNWRDAMTGYMALSSILSWAQTADEMKLVAHVFNHAIKNGPKDVASARAQEFMRKFQSPEIGIKPVAELDIDAFGETLSTLYDSRR